MPARRASGSEAEALAPTTKPKSDPYLVPPPHDHDVLLFVDRAGPYRAWYLRNSGRGEALGNVPGAVEPVMIQLAPGLSVCDAQHWPRLRTELRFQERIAAGQIKVVAGADEPIEDGWYRTRQRNAISMLEKTGHIPTLERLRDIESKADRPRHDVANMIDARLQRLRKAVEQHRQAQRTAVTRQVTKAW